MNNPLLSESNIWSDGACVGMNPDLFTLPAFQRTEEQEVLAKAACADCIVRAPCLEYALDDDNSIANVGIWGGLNEEERALLATQRQQPES